MKPYTQVTLGKTYKAVSGVSGIAVVRSEHSSGCCQIGLQPKAKSGETKEPELIWVAEPFALGLVTKEQLKTYNPPPRHPVVGKIARSLPGFIQIKGRVGVCNVWWPEGMTKVSIEDPTLNQDRKTVSHSFHLDEIDWEGKTETEKKAPVAPGGPTKDRDPRGFHGA
jgi:hypothetical protein